MFKSQGVRMAALAGLSLLMVSSAADAGGRKHHAPQGGVRVGVLTCDVKGGEGYVVGSSKAVRCLFDGGEGRVERYTGKLDKLGVDVGVTDGGKLSWIVIAPTADVGRGALAGEYVGASAEATVGGGASVYVLVGGSNDTLSLQPVSAGLQTGLNVAAGAAQLTLKPHRS